VLIALAIALAAAFGASDQYLGSLPGAHVWAAHVPWLTDVSLLSAPWLFLAFLAGCTQRKPTRAALLGFACTISALIGYGLMTLSPIEGAHLTLRSIAGFVWSSDRVLAGGLVSGPLFGWLGYRWGSMHLRFGALVMAAAFCFEPLARVAAGQAIRFHGVWVAEVTVGIAMALCIALAPNPSKAV
jgi:hypothetical protein